MDNLTELFNNVAEIYDSQRKKLIPCFDDFYFFITKLAEMEKADGKILDIGAGTGLLTDFIVAKYPQAEFTLIDISDEMLKVAQKRFGNKNNIKYITSDYVKYNFTETYDVIVSALSIHHLEDQDKKGLYKKIYSLLNKGGIFINGDQFLLRSKNDELSFQKIWRKHIEKTDISEEEKIMIGKRMKLDKHATVDNNIKWMEEAGFTDIDLFYKYYIFGVLRGKK